MIEAILYARELLFICPPQGTNRITIDGLLAEDFVEIGASGRICSRADGIEVLHNRAAQPAAEPYDILDFKARNITDDCYLTLYILSQPARITRRATLWRLEGDVWRAVYHQGTLANT